MSPKELANFQKLLASHFTSPVQSKDLSISLRHSIFGEKSLMPDSTMYAESSCTVTSQVVHIDSLDRQLLFLMNGSSFTSLTQLARDTNHPLSTIDYRVKQLKDRQVICADLQDEFHTFVRAYHYVTDYSYYVGT